MKNTPPLVSLKLIFKFSGGHVEVKLWMNPEARLKKDPAVFNGPPTHALYVICLSVFLKFCAQIPMVIQNMATSHSSSTSSVYSNVKLKLNTGHSKHCVKCQSSASLSNVT